MDKHVGAGKLKVVVVDREIKLILIINLDILIIWMKEVLQELVERK